MKGFEGNNLRTIGQKILLLLWLVTAVFTTHLTLTQHQATLEAPWP
ncbi:MAG: hypothetical protein R3D55_07395 [Chloroflexota bacterium]